MVVTWNSIFLEVASMVVTWRAVAFMRSVCSQGPKVGVSAQQSSDPPSC